MQWMQCVCREIDQFFSTHFFCSVQFYCAWEMCDKRGDALFRNSPQHHQESRRPLLVRADTSQEEILHGVSEATWRNSRRALHEWVSLFQHISSIFFIFVFSLLCLLTRRWLGNWYEYLSWNFYFTARSFRWNFEEFSLGMKTTINSMYSNL